MIVFARIQTMEYMRKSHFISLYHGDGIILNVLPDLNMDDILRLRKPHPCGGDEWKVVRLGADIGLECCRCQRRVMLPRRELARRLKTVVRRGANEPESQ